MLVNLVNNSGFKKIRVWCDGKEYFLGQRELVTVDVNRKFKLKVFTQEKNHMTFDFIFFSLMVFLMRNSLVMLFIMMLSLNSRQTTRSL